jgi:hypothetical protein
MRSRHVARLLVAYSLMASCARADPAVPTFRITQLFSTIDGELQFIELTETGGNNGQQHFAGLSLTATHDDVVKRFTFPADLPSDQTAHQSIIVAATPNPGVPVGDDRGYNCCYQPTLLALPPRFLPTDGGTVDFAGVDRVTYATLPVDGHAIDHDGNPVTATVPRGSACAPGIDCSGPRLTVSLQYFYTPAVEYYNPALDHYFISASAPDIDALDSGRIQGWRRTGETFVVSAAPGMGLGMNDKVCRYRLPPVAGDSHFFSAIPAECAGAFVRPSYVLETDAAFYVALPDPNSGACPPGGDVNGDLMPVYRLWNQRADSNHRYTASRQTRDAMVARGYVAEGYGPDAVAFCAY